MGGDKTISNSRRIGMINVACSICLCVLLGPVGCTHQASMPAEPKHTTATREDTVFTCPDGDIPKAGSNDHKVTLTWEASASGPRSKIRYCLYRSEDHRVRKSGDHVPINKSPCKACTRIDETATEKTSYIDKQVRNGAHYCYVAVATEIGKCEFSEFSNQAEADIPRDPLPVAGQVSSGKMCEEKIPSKRPKKQDSVMITIPRECH